MTDLNFFHKIFLLQDMDAAEVQEVLKIATPRPYPVGAVIIHEGEALEHSIRLSLVTRARCSSLSVRAWRAARTLGSATALAKPSDLGVFFTDLCRLGNCRTSAITGHRVL
jgi:hypothetical protein